MELVIPYLFPSIRLAEIATPGLLLPGLTALLGRGTPHPCPAHGVEALLCEACGITRQHDYPIAPLTLAADGGTPGSSYWLRADPVHLQVMRDRIVLAGGEQLALQADEAAQLVASLHGHFGDTLPVQAVHPARWYLPLATPPDLTTTPPSLAVGRDLSALQPGGAEAQRWRACINEAQMLLHAHPVNLAREARGALTVNSLWLWGGGVMPPMPAAHNATVLTDTDWRALSPYGVSPLRGGSLPVGVDKIVLEALVATGQTSDAPGWRAALSTLEKDWFTPLWQQLRRPTGLSELHLIDPVHGHALRLRRRDSWKLWRRPCSLLQFLTTRDS